MTRGIAVSAAARYVTMYTVRIRFTSERTCSSGGSYVSWITEDAYHVFGRRICPTRPGRGLAGAWPGPATTTADGSEGEGGGEGHRTALSLGERRAGHRRHRRLLRSLYGGHRKKSFDQTFCLN